MPHRSLRLRTFTPRPARGGESGRGAALLRERPSSPPQAPREGRDGDGHGEGHGTGQQDDNPFAPPPEGTPDNPWRPRHHAGSPGSGPGDSGRGSGSGGPEGGSPWGNQWSDRQPGRSSGGGFGERPGPGRGPQGPGGGQTGGGMRWDPTDPAQRRARYALLSGMWAVFFALFSWPYVALLLGVLALYWGVSALRAKPRTPGPDTPPAPGAGRPQVTAAVGGLVTASLALMLVASTFTVQFVYRDYYTCVNDALTHEAKQSCDTLLPQQLRGVLGVGNS
ncbi:hypothetical protein [Streptomyces monashensis]|uniref:DUF4190 domain-containing protein n=1 Tax=Streptomyces monashensis TaxID=1678012 RepID=A0A1S2QFU9_9ACTN|nr:hypothetical protein [Streptomyces monashensis]OIK04954.1 hypothetical protein BIV23_14115 [Streptomyces monashensis]